MKNLRRASQIIFLIIFILLFIQTEYKGTNELGLPVKLFLDFDPLIALSTILATHTVRAIFLLSALMLIATIFLGRFFCGWVCPLGTINTAISYFRMKTLKPGKNEGRFPGLRALKYYILVFIIVSALLGWNSAGFLDPISLTIRSLAIGYNPVVNKIVTSILNSIYSLNIPGISPLADTIYYAMKGTVLPFEQPIFRQTILIGSIFTIILLLNIAAPRFWCRYLCPLGALYGLLAKWQVTARIKLDSDKCISCRKCIVACQGDATPFPENMWASRECLVCFNCRDVCPVDAISIGPGRDTSSEGNVDLERRWLVAGIASAAIAVPVLSVSASRKRTSPLLIRPPGALAEEEFVSRCVKCGECMKVCLTNGLHPTLTEAGLEGLWTPVLVPRLGYCEYNCNLCSQVCPTGAIRKITVEEKKKIKIGLAFIDKNRCIPYTFGKNCIVCEEHCPVPDKAIKFHTEKITGADGEEITLKKPYVIPELCIGCGICENKCPVSDIPAIRVTAINEDRNKSGSLFLEG